MKKVLLCVLSFSLYTHAFAQGELPVDMYSGTPGISVPLWNLTMHDIAVPIELSYDAAGVKLEQSDGWFGIGWNLNAGGAIHRHLRGLPDDFTGTTTDPRRGWLYLNGSVGVAADIGAFNNSADTSPATCTDEQADNAKLSLYNDVIDTEPDIFSFNFGGYSGSFVFDNSSTPVIRLIPYSDLSIVYSTVSATDKTITGFVIHTNDGFKYTFGRTVISKKGTKRNAAVDFSSHELNQYDLDEYPQVSYASDWKLTRIESPSGAYADFTFQLVTPTEDVSTVRNAGIYFDNLSSYKLVHVYTIEESTEKYWLDKISGSSGQEVVFGRLTDNFLDKVIVNDTRKGLADKFVKEYFLEYKTIWGRKFLKKISEVSGCEKLPPYTFNYIAEGNTLSGLPTENSNAKDFWGYYNGKDNNNRIPKMYIYPTEPLAERFRLYPIPSYAGTEIILDGADRTPDEDYMKIGTLNKITYPSGGSVIVQYEANTYYDSRANKTNLMGGLRIKSISLFDGMNNVGEITKTFEYQNPSSGFSSGKLFSMPMFIAPTWKYRNPSAMNEANLYQSYDQLSATKTTAELWKYLTLRTEEDIVDEAIQENVVAYQFVTVKKTGSGSARHEFYVPGSYGELTNGNWIATQNKFARPNTCPPMGIVASGGAWAYPYAPNPVFYQERGLLFKKHEFNEAGVLVRFSQNDYQYLYRTQMQTEPLKVYGVRYDRFPNSDAPIFFYGKYFLPTDYNKIISKETVTTYDVADASKYATESTEYFYESTFHKLLTKVKTVTSEGSVYTTKFRYPLDFGTIPVNSEPALLRIKELQDPVNFRHGTVVEQISFAKPPGGTEKVTDAALTTFSNFSEAGKIYQESSWSLSLTSPITTFIEATYELQSGTYKLKMDPNYEVVQTISGYGLFNTPKSIVGQNKIPIATVWGYGNTLPIATVANASKEQYAFSDFETTTTDEFVLQNAYYAMPRTGKQGLHPYATLSKTITKATASNYILNFWLKNPTSVSFRVLIKSTNLATTYYDNTFSVTPVSASSFEYVRRVIPVSSAPAQFVIQLIGQSLSQPSSSSSTLLPAIDDVTFYPEAAVVTSSTFQIPYGMNSSTDGTGITLHIVYDKLGRNLYAIDQDGNIKGRNAYVYSQLTSALSAGFSYPQTVYKGEPATFTAIDNNCIEGVTYAWDWGTSTFVNGSLSMSHTFTAEGTYPVRLKVSHPTLGQIISSISQVVVTLKPIPVNVCANGAVTYQCSDEIYFATSCSGVPSPSEGTLFKVTVDESIAGLTYTWKKRFIDSGVWTTVGTNSNEYAITMVSSNSKAFEIKCIATAPDGRTGHATYQIDVLTCN